MTYFNEYKMHITYIQGDAEVLRCLKQDDKKK